MRRWLRGAPGGLVAFGLIAALVAGGLGWATAAALRLEEEQRQARAEAERDAKVRLALRRLDGRISPLLAQEDSRPYNDYSALFRPTAVFVPRGDRLQADRTVLELSPLLDAELPDWMLLHFQADNSSGWGSPQVPHALLIDRLKKGRASSEFRNVTPERARLLKDLSGRLPVNTLLAALGPKGGVPAVHDKTVMLFTSNYAQLWAQNPHAQENNDAETNNRFQQQLRFQSEFNPARGGRSRDGRDNVTNNIEKQGMNWLDPARKASGTDVEVGVTLSPMVPAWAREGRREYLLLVRQVEIEQSRDSKVCQGIVLEPERLRAMLTAEVADLLPGSSLSPVREAVAPNPERTMATLPFQLDPGPLALRPAPRWTPLRIGLALAWAAAGIALLAVGLGGWFLLDLSERRFRFVSAVTHELRTPLTTLRLYLDMLTGGMVRDEARRGEYLRTLHDEADRLSRLVTNVLDFSRLERQRPRLARSRSTLSDLLAQVRAAWQSRCHDAGKELVVECALPEESVLETDIELLHQVLGNLIDNACKYSRDAADPRVWLRVGDAGGRVAFEVEDGGPGVPPRERRSIFRPFQRGRGADATGGGVGLGLALARRWARLLGGTLSLRPSSCGACFRLEVGHIIPQNSPS